MRLLSVRALDANGRMVDRDFQAGDLMATGLHVRSAVGRNTVPAEVSAET
jgi:hypothetical protein